MSNPIVAVCVPIAEKVHGDAFQAIMSLDIPRPFHLLVRREAPVENARNEIVGRVLTDPSLADVTHLLWIDDDMVFRQDALRRLLAHDLPIVGGLCHGRRFPAYSPILCYKRNGGGGYAYRHEYPIGLVEVDATGAAFILVKRDVYEEIEKKFPVNGEGPYSNLGNGEDVSFCERAKECGFKVFVDTSLEIGHIGEVVIDSVFARKNRAAEFNAWSPPTSRANGDPVASIVIPTWNTDPVLLRSAVESALAQSVPVEVIVVDDGSEPAVEMKNLLIGDTPNIGDERTRLIRTEHRGCFHALNVGIAAMKTDLFAWLSADDVFYSRKIERQARAMESAGERASFHGYDVIRSDHAAGAMLPTPWRNVEECRRLLSRGCYVNGLTTLIHRSALDEVRLPNGDVFDESITIASDWDLWNRIAGVTFWLPISEILAGRREHGDNASTRYASDPEKVKTWQAEDAAIRAQYAPRCPSCGAAT